MTKRKRGHEGIETRHQRACRTRTGGACNCTPTYQASAYIRREARTVKRTFAALADAKAWRRDAQREIAQGARRGPSRLTIREAAKRWLADVDAGRALTRKGTPYKPSAVTTARGGLREDGPLMRAIGDRKMEDVTRHDLNQLVRTMIGDGKAPSTIRNTIIPLRVLYREQIESGRLTVNPCAGLKLPRVEPVRDRIADPVEAAQLIDHAPPADAPLWATALWAGLRLGELGGLQWGDVDFAAGVVRVERAWDRDTRSFITPKSRAGRRRVPLDSDLRRILAAHKLAAADTSGDALVFAERPGVPFNAERARRRARRAWTDAGMAPIGFHECRHSYASTMIAAGTNAKSLSTYMGHASVAITLDLYGHLFAQAEEDDAARVDAYKQRVRDSVRDSPAAKHAET